MYTDFLLPFCTSFIITPCLLMAAQPCMEWNPIKIKKRFLIDISNKVIGQCFAEITWAAPSGTKTPTYTAHVINYGTTSDKIKKCK